MQKRTLGDPRPLSAVKRHESVVVLRAELLDLSRANVTSYLPNWEICRDAERLCYPSPQTPNVGLCRVRKREIVGSDWCLDEEIY